MVRRGNVLLAVTILFGVLYLAATVVLGSPPDASDDTAAIRSFFSGHGGEVRAWAFLLTLSSPVFAVFAALVRARLPEVWRDVFFFGAVAFAAETAVQAWIWAGLALHPGAIGSDTFRALFDVASYWGPVLTSTTMIMLGPVAVLGLREEGGIPRWLGVVAAVALAEQLVETITIFGHDGFIAPGGPMNVDLGAGLTGVALLCVGVALGRRRAPAGVTP
jgi:hypothetical protein